MKYIVGDNAVSIIIHTDLNLMLASLPWPNDSLSDAIFPDENTNHNIGVTTKIVHSIIRKHCATNLLIIIIVNLWDDSRQALLTRTLWPQGVTAPLVYDRIFNTIQVQ